MFQRSTGIFFIEDRLTRKQESLQTRDRKEAVRLLHAKNEAHVQPAINLQIARAYLTATDPQIAKRTWQNAFGTLIEAKEGETKARWQRGAKQKAFDLIRERVILETQAEHFLAVLNAGTVSTNHHLRQLHNFALGMNWLPWSILPKKQWPRIRFKERRAITLEEHERIIAREGNPERRAFYELCWHLGGSQGDIAALTAEEVDWRDRTIAYRRRKTQTPALIRFSEGVARILETTPKTGPLFPYLVGVRATDRGTEFKQRCVSVGISGVTLHSYRYAWAERAKTAGYPERFAQEALGHNSKAVHRAYAKKAKMKLPSLEDYESGKIVAVEFNGPGDGVRAKTQA